jgi:hypothetical protein
MASFGINGVKPSTSATRELVNWSYNMKTEDKGLTSSIPADYDDDDCDDSVTLMFFENWFCCREWKKNYFISQ